MKLIQIYQCFCDETRLRILNLLRESPLCVCHFQEILGESQVKISKHLAYLKSKGLVEAQRHQNWMIYRLPRRPSSELASNLACLEACRESEPRFQKDLKLFGKYRDRIGWLDELCCAKPLSRFPAKAEKKPENTLTSRPRRSTAALRPTA